MKQPEDKKTRLVSTRMTKAQYESVKNKSRERNMSVSSSVVNAAVHSNNHVNPHQIMKLQNLANMAADACETTQPELAERIRKEADALWQF